MSVQPTSEKRTTLQLSASAAKAAVESAALAAEARMRDLMVRFIKEFLLH
jgi:hypothetical protein